MIRKQWIALSGAGLLVLSGCKTFGSNKVEVQETPSVAVRNNCYSLLYQLLNEEKGISRLSLIKKEPPRVKDLVKKIAETSGAGAALVKQMADKDPTLDLKDIALPPGEEATRAAISKDKEHELLTEKGAALDLTLLLAQAEALNYGAHLAGVAAQNETQKDRADQLMDLRSDYLRLREQVVAEIGSGLDR